MRDCSGFDLGHVDLFDIEITFCGDNSFSKPWHQQYCDKDSGNEFSIC